MNICKDMEGGNHGVSEDRVRNTMKYLGWDSWWLGWDL